MDEKKLFELFKNKEGLELYEDVKFFIEKEKVNTAESQTDKRKDFAFLMMNTWNNAGWDDENRWSGKLDLIRDELVKIHDDRLAYKLEEED